MIATILAAVLYTTTESGGWTENAVDPANKFENPIALFETDGATARAGSMPWRAWGTTFNELDLDALKLLTDDEREEIMRKLFAPDGELKFTRGRITMNANDYSRAWYSCSEKDGDFELAEFNIEHDKTNQIALIKMAQKYNPNLVFWVSPWSPPAWMKINKDYCVVSSRFNNQPKEKDALLFGGKTEEIDPNEMWLQGDRRKLFPRRLATQNYFIQDPEYLQAYADMFAKFVALYAAEGVKIDRVMYQNEAYSYTPYPGCPWTAEGIVRFNRDYLAPTLKAKCPGVHAQGLGGTCGATGVAGPEADGGGTASRETEFRKRHAGDLAVVGRTFEGGRLHGGVCAADGGHRAVARIARRRHGGGREARRNSRARAEGVCERGRSGKPRLPWTSVKAWSGESFPKDHKWPINPQPLYWE